MRGSELTAASATEPALLLEENPAGIRMQGEATYRAGRALPRAAGRPAGGIFAEWSWDGAALQARTDRYGICPLYFASWPGHFAISPSVQALLDLGAPADIDEAALAVFLRVGFFLAEDTPFRAIRALPPGACVEWRDGRLQVSGQLFIPRPQRLSRDAAIDGYFSLFAAAVARDDSPGDDIAVPLSGGRDSRHILLELCRTGRAPRLCVTMRHYAPRPDEDAVVAADVALALGVPHVVLPQRVSRVSAEIRKNRLTGFCADEHAWALPILDCLRGRVRCIYDGIGGDVLSAGLFLTPARLALYEAGRLEDLAAGLALGPERFLARVLAPEWASRLARDAAIARLVAELARHAGAPNPVGSFIFWNRTRREIALLPYRILSRGVDVVSPYLDHDLYDFLAALPAAMLIDHELHTETIRRGYPQYRALRFEDKAAPRRRAPGEVRRFARDLAAYAISTAALRPRLPLVRTGFLVSRALRAMVVGDRDVFDRLLPVLSVYLLQLSREVRPSPDDQLARRRKGQRTSG